MTAAPARPAADGARNSATSLGPRGSLPPSRAHWRRRPRAPCGVRPVPTPPRPLPGATGPRWARRHPAAGLTETARENTLRRTRGGNRRNRKPGTQPGSGSRPPHASIERREVEKPGSRAGMHRCPATAAGRLSTHAHSGRPERRGGKTEWGAARARGLVGTLGGGERSSGREAWGRRDSYASTTLRGFTPHRLFFSFPNTI